MSLANIDDAKEKALKNLFNTTKFRVDIDVFLAIAENLAEYH